MKSLAILLGVPVAIWAVLAYPAWLIWGDDSFRHAGVALALCLVPALLTYVAIQWFVESAETRMMATLGSSGIRMAVALGGGMLLFQKLPDLFPVAFMGWLVVFYLLVLGLEVGLLVQRPVSGPTSQV